MMGKGGAVILRLVSWPLLAAIGLSLLLHFFLLVSAAPFWVVVPTEIDFPIEATLESLPAAPPAKPAPPAEKPPARLIPSPAAPGPEPVPAPESPIPAAAEVAEPVATEVLAPAPRVEVAEPPSGAEPPDQAPAPPLRRAMRQLPEDLEIRYAVAVGEEGFVVGEAVYQWHARQGRYSLVNTLQATGLAALFIHGRIVQVSEGTMDDEGLRPEQYWLKRGERKQDTARFIWSQNRLDLGGKRGVHDLTAQAQDLLSFPFHLAMTTREAEPDFSMGVTNGRRFKQYAFRNLGRSSIELGRQKVEALHLQGRREGEGTLDVWLDPARTALPIKVRTLDEKGKTMMLLLQSMREISRE
jgi:hypothetical protein